MGVVTVHAGRRHDDRSGEPHATVENRTRSSVNACIRVLTQGLQRLLLEGVEGMRRTIFERIVREKAELRIAVTSVDQIAELERERGRDRDGAGDLLIMGSTCVFSPWASTRPTTLLA